MAKIVWTEGAIKDIENFEKDCLACQQFRKSYSRAFSRRIQRDIQIAYRRLEGCLFSGR